MMKVAEKINITRIEEKYPIDFMQYTGLCADLNAALLPDPHNGVGGYMVRSVYFDDYSDSAYYDKLNGTQNRVKLRLRVYSPADTTVKTELKIKSGQYQRKVSLSIGRDTACALIRREYERVLAQDSHLEEVLLENGVCLQNMHPVLMNQYRRLAFAHPVNNIRLTLDSELVSSETNFDLFAKHPPLLPVFDFHTALLEVKYDNFLFKWISDILSAYRLNAEAHSKYLYSRRIFGDYFA